MYIFYFFDKKLVLILENFFKVKVVRKNVYFFHQKLVVLLSIFTVVE